MKPDARRRAERRGRRAEWLALGALALKGYLPIARRARTPLGEIDLIVRRGRVLVAVEVKARPEAEAALDAVAPRQRARLFRALDWWVARHPRFAEDDRRFDLVLVSPRRWPRHVANAFDAFA
jgi:putative endonuclease